MYSQLGHLRFERTTYFTGQETTQRYDFAEHQVVKGKPRLQAMGDALEALTLDMRFHHSWCNPAEVEGKLKEAAARKEAMALVFGDGTYKGRYVITEISSTVGHALPTGYVYMLDARIQLKEWADSAPLTTATKRQAAKAQAVKIAGGAAPAKAKAGTPPFTVRTAVNKDTFATSKIVRQS